MTLGFLLGNLLVRQFLRHWTPILLARLLNFSIFNHLLLLIYHLPIRLLLVGCNFYFALILGLGLAVFNQWVRALDISSLSRLLLQVSIVPLSLHFGRSLAMLLGQNLLFSFNLVFSWSLSEVALALLHRHLRLRMIFVFLLDTIIKP